MDVTKLRALKGFYENELTNNILPFWLEKSVDTKYGGFFSCFDNAGKDLLSTDKYTWSQGRFVWLFSKLASMQTNIFTRKQHEHFLSLAKSGNDFLMQHCLVAPNVYRCVYLMDRTGAPKKVPGYDSYDPSYTVDAFIIAGISQYASVTKNEQSYQFAKALFQSFMQRIVEEEPTLPYRWSKRFLFQGNYQNINWLTTELYYAAQALDPDYCGQIKEYMRNASSDMLKFFVDEKKNFRDMVFSSPIDCPDNLLANHINPGHAFVNMSYLFLVSDILEDPHYAQEACAVTKRILDVAWDEPYGGYPHFCGVEGGEPVGSLVGYEDEFFAKMIPTDWADKLWWVEAEDLCAAIRCFEHTNDPDFLTYHDRLFEYVFSTFPNPDRETREWVQIMKRDGTPLQKVTAVPVKDPFHISRSLIRCIESIDRMLQQ